LAQNHSVQRADEIPSGAAPPGLQVAVACILLLVCSFLLFFRLGHYALWDDESYTALIGQGVWRTGDTSAVIGHNIVAFRQGALLTNLKERYLPPLSYYVDAPFAEFADGGSAMPRLPFAVCGLLTIMLILWWLHRGQAPWNVWVLSAMGIIGNVSLFLYFRQARYYGLSILLSVLIAYHWTHWDGRRWRLLIISIAGAALLATNYLNYAALAAAAAADYFLFARRNAKITWPQISLLLIPQIICAAIIVPIWNPLAKHPTGDVHESLAGRCTVFWRYFRDMNACEFGVGIFWLLCPLIYFWNRNIWALRAPLVLVVYIAVTAAFCPPQDLSEPVPADIRYACACIPLCIAIAVILLAQFRGRFAILGLALGCIAFGTNLFEGGARLFDGLQSTLWQYCRELADPPPDPFRAASDWINQHVNYGQSVWALPEYATYPLMYHAPQAVYAFQLSYPPQEQFKDLPRIHFAGQALPDFILTFGSDSTGKLLRNAPFPPGVKYGVVDALPVNGFPAYRPELFWRSFRGLPCDLNKGEGIYCFELLPQ
jgi:hypothetical protein